MYPQQQVVLVIGAALVERLYREERALMPEVVHVGAAVLVWMWQA